MNNQAYLYPNQIKILTSILSTYHKTDLSKYDNILNYLNEIKDLTIRYNDFNYS